MNIFTKFHKDWTRIVDFFRGRLLPGQTFSRGRTFLGIELFPKPRTFYLLISGLLLDFQEPKLVTQFRASLLCVQTYVCHNFFHLLRYAGIELDFLRMYLLYVHFQQGCIQEVSFGYKNRCLKFSRFIFLPKIQWITLLL